MTPLNLTMMGYVSEEPEIKDHGPYMGKKPTLVVDVFYKAQRVGYIPADGYKVDHYDKRRHFPFIIEHKLLPDIRKGKPWKGQFVVVNFTLDITNEQDGSYRVYLIANRVESILRDFPEAKINEGALWLDLNVIESELPDVSL